MSGVFFLVIKENIESKSKKLTSRMVDSVLGGKSSVIGPWSSALGSWSLVYFLD